MRMSGRSMVTWSVRHVVLEVRVDRRLHRRGAGLHVGDEGQQRPLVVGLGEALAVQDPAGLEHAVGQQEAIGGDQLDPRMVRPAAEQGLEHAGGGGLAHRHRTGDPDDERHLLGRATEEHVGDAVQVLGRRHVQVEQAGQRQVDLGDLVEVEGVVDPAQVLDVLGRQGQRRRSTQPRPLLAVEADPGGDGLVEHGPSGGGGSAPTVVPPPRAPTPTTAGCVRPGRGTRRPAAESCGRGCPHVRWGLRRGQPPTQRRVTPWRCREPRAC